MQTSAIFFWGNDFAQAKQLALAMRAKGGKAVTRDASVFAGDIEPCERVVMMPSVHPTHAARIRIAYAGAGIHVEHLTRDDVPALPDAQAPEVMAVDPLKTAPVTTRELMRLSNKQLTELAHARGIIFDTLDRASMISALSAAAKEPPS